MKQKKSIIKPLGKDRYKQYRQPKKPDKKNSYADLLGLISIILLGIIIYSNSFNCSFHVDDALSIVDNPKIRNLFDMKALWSYSQTRFVPYYTFAVNYHFGALNVWGYHLVNLIIHLINACLVYWLTMLIFSSPALKNHAISNDKKVLAFFTALLFVSHPLATQSVTYIVQRMASLAAMFYLLSLALYIKARLTEKSNLSKYLTLRVLLFAGALISSVLAMLSKENTFTLPLAIVLLEIFFLRTTKLSINFKDNRVILLMAVFLGFVLIVLFKFSFSIFNPIPPRHGNTYTVTSLNYLFTQFSVIVKYIQLLFLPINQNWDYDFPISNNFFEIRTVLSFFLLLSLIILAVILFKRQRLISFGIFWFFLALSIESSIIPIDDLIFEHRTYLPSYGFFLILSFGIYDVLWKKYKFFAISIYIILIGSNSFLTYERNKVWENNLSLWSDVVSKSPGKARPFGSRGDCYRDLGQWDKSIADYTRAILINPGYATAYHDRGGVYANLGQWNRALSDYSRAIEIDPKYMKAYYNRGIANLNLGQLDNAITDFSKTIEIDPKNTNAYSNRGITYAKLGQWNKSIADYSNAIKIDLKYKHAYSNRGIAYGNLGQWDKSITDFSKAIEIDPLYSTAYFNRGIAYGNLGQWDKSLADFSKAIEIDPKYAAAYSHRDIALSKLHNEKKQ